MIHVFTPFSLFSMSDRGVAERFFQAATPTVKTHLAVWQTESACELTALPRQSMVGDECRSCGRLSGPLRARFQIRAHASYYSKNKYKRFIHLICKYHQLSLMCIGPAHYNDIPPLPLGRRRDCAVPFDRFFLTEFHWESTCPKSITTPRQAGIRHRHSC